MLSSTAAHTFAALATLPALHARFTAVGVFHVLI
jgi:hypothetical protein